jgi:cysteine desulfurase/selenocysteine lyase
MTSTESVAVNPAFDVAAVRRDFPILSTTMHGKPLVFLDSAASAQKPRQVIDAVRDVYEREYANVHRGLYAISEAVTARYEGTRETIRAYINAAHAHEIVFTRNATESINLVAYTFGRHFLSEGDEVLISGLEHHSNIVPWQMLRDEKGIVLKVVPVSDDGELMVSAFDEMLGERTKLVAMAHMSNVLGTVLPVAEITRKAHAAGAKVLLDGCQAVTHIPVDMQALGCDFYVFSGHKLYGPSGIGVLYGREELLDAMPPFMGGGDMISSVTFEKSTWARLPHKFEAGTPAIAQAIGLGAAIDYVNSVGLSAIGVHEADLLNYATQQLASVEGLRIIGTAPDKASVVSFVLNYAHPHDIATIIDRAGVAVRAGHHCAKPLMDRMDVPATVRASIGMYNMRADIDALVGALGEVQELFG